MMFATHFAARVAPKNEEPRAEGLGPRRGKQFKSQYNPRGNSDDQT